MMKLNKIATLLVFFIPAYACALDHTNNITIKGEAYNACTVNWPAKLSMGAHRAKQWVNNYLIPADESGVVKITLSDCDPGTVVKIYGNGTVSPTNAWFLKNLDAEQSLMASLQVQKIPELTWNTINMANNKSHAVTITTVRNATDTQEVKLRGIFRRPNATVQPVGTFRATPTLILAFE